MSKLYCVYILRCADDTFYTGVTNDIERRYREHMSGKNPDTYTFKRRPVEVEFIAEFSDPYVAFDWEKRIKGWTRAKKEALIDGDFDRLQYLAECRNFTHSKFKPG